MTGLRILPLVSSLAVFVMLAFGEQGVFGQGAPAGQSADSDAVAPPAVLKGKLERVKVTGKSLAGNLMKESDSPEVSIYLPPGYLTDRTRRFPVVYVLHGYTGTDLSYFGSNAQRQLHVVADRVFTTGAAREMILVMLNCMNAYGGCMYANSPTSGYWEDYIADDLVAYIDKNYRTIARREARGLAGHSMGGYGTFKIGMKRPDVFAALYASSSCCVTRWVATARSRSA
jgi:S-formylglutathione hydrolase